MKKIFALTLLVSLALTTPAYAAIPTTAPTSGADSQKLDKQINQLKDKIASRVSQLNLVEKRGVIGQIQDVKDNKITLTTLAGDVQYIDIDEITKFSSAGSRTKFGVSDLQKGMEISVLGIYNKESQRILARFIDTYTMPVRYSGEITSLDTKNYQLTMMTTGQKSVKVDVGTTTTVSSYTPSAEITKYGFSKLAVGDSIQVIGYPDKKDATLLVADRLIDLLNAPKDKNIAIVTPTSSPAIAPTSPGAKSIKPIK